MSIDFENMCWRIATQLQRAPKVNVGEWHAQKVDHPMFVTRELTNQNIRLRIPETVDELQDFVKPNLPFAEAQFRDRVSGEPLNPPPSHNLWPWAHEESMPDGKFSHTYPERFWPKDDVGLKGYCISGHRHGIRYPYGDLEDMVDQLVRNPYTRQAYLPVFFPEDTGNVSNVRVPCTLGYHFLYREGKLNITYFIRAVDFLRHFRDDVYMAARLCQWVLAAAGWGERKPGMLTMHIVSLHCMEGDLPKLKKVTEGASHSR